MTRNLAIKTMNLISNRNILSTTNSNLQKFLEIYHIIIVMSNKENPYLNRALYCNGIALYVNK